MDLDNRLKKSAFFTSHLTLRGKLFCMFETHGRKLSHNLDCTTTFIRVMATMTKTLLVIVICAFVSHSCKGAAPNTGPSHKLKIHELDYYVNTAEGRALLENEFQSIENGKRKPWTVAELPLNKKKNRFEYLMAYDDTRVVLDTLPGEPNSDYINANYIDGQNREREYVATQAPLSNTVNDFWRMIWQLNATTIIMFANRIGDEEIRVEKYWPETAEDYGDITLTKFSQYEMPKLQHVVRTFSLRKRGVANPRLVRHFHFTGWPDLGMPKDRLSIISLLEQARKYQSYNKAPIVIHCKCSTGMGRTGTIILTDSMIQKARAEGVVDFPQRLDQMRLQRVNLVEKKEQYVFAHKAIYDLFNGAETEEYLKNADSEYKKIDKVVYEDVLNDFSQLMEKMKLDNNGNRNNS